MQRLILVFLKVVGVLLILVGLVAAYYGPLEIFVFYLFSEGGQFYYDGFGMGSFWFADLVVQNIGYYLIAALFIPVGLGHVKLRRWALTLTQLYLWFWLGTGVVLFGSFILLIPSIFKLELSQGVLLLQLVTIGVPLLVALLLLPVAGLWFYKSAIVKSVFGEHDTNIYWTERYPFHLLALLLLFIIMIIVLHLTIFFQGLFPLFGQIIMGRQSAYMIALCILILGILIYGTVRLEKWAWWGSIVYVSLLAVSSALSFSRYSFYDIILMMNLPAYEMGFLNRMVVLHDAHIAGLIVAPLVIALGLIAYSKRYYGESHMLRKPNTS
jgi:hypothetical protein